MSAKLIISVTSDLSTDQRVHKVSQTCHDLGYRVTLVGRETGSSLPVGKRDYRTYRFRLPFRKKAGFYASYNIRLFIYLLTHRADILISNDLDTLLANYLAARLRRIPLIYDSHEYFTEVPELRNRPRVREIWLRIEKSIFPRLKHIYTVNETIAGIYRAKYHREVRVIRNVPLLNREHRSGDAGPGYLLPANRKILIYQGAGINRERGAEELVMAMSLLPAGEFFLVIAGSGDVIGDLKRMTEELRLLDRVMFMDLLPFDRLSALTLQAHLGLTLDKPDSLNYRYSLPNKLFDYIHAGIPVLASNLPEVRAVIEHYGIGICLEEITPHHIAEKIRFMFADQERYATWKQHAEKAAPELCWEKESLVLAGILHNLSPGG